MPPRHLVQVVSSPGPFISFKLHALWSAMHLFPDTHFFLHYRHAQELPWGEVTDADPIRLIVGRTVQKEIEKHKHEMRGRAQDRARDYATKLARVVVDERPVVLREKRPQVLLDFYAVRSGGWSPPAELDPGWGDDMLAADILAFRSAYPEADVAVLTGDPGLIARARSFAIPVVALAGRGWEQPAEKSAAEKEAEKLRRENEDLKSTGPFVACNLFVNDRAVEKVRLEVIRHPPLTPDQLGQLLGQARARHKRASDFSLPPSPPRSGAPLAGGVDLSSLGEPVEWRAPTQEEIDAYAQRCDRWFDELTAFLRETPATLDQASAHVDLRLVLDNNGNQPGQGIRLTIETLGGLLLSDLNLDEEDEDKAAESPIPRVPERFRAPPAPPQPTRVVKPRPPSPSRGASAVLAQQLADLHRADRFGSIVARTSEIDRMTRLLGPTASRPGFASSSLERFLDPSRTAYAVAAPITEPPLLRPFVRPSRDPHAFYWRKTPSRTLVDRWELECDEFQHRMDPEVFNIRVTAHADDGQPRQGAIRVRLFASNMRQPFEKTVPIRVERVEVDTFALMAGLLPP